MREVLFPPPGGGSPQHGLDPSPLYSSNRVSYGGSLSALDAIFRLCVRRRLPLHVADAVSPTLAQRYDVIFDVAGTRTIALAG